MLNILLMVTAILLFIEFIANSFNKKFLLNFNSICILIYILFSILVVKIISKINFFTLSIFFIVLNLIYFYNNFNT